MLQLEVNDILPYAQEKHEELSNKLLSVYNKDVFVKSTASFLIFNFKIRLAFFVTFFYNLRFTVCFCHFRFLFVILCRALKSV